MPLDDCLYALQPTIPHLTRSSLHRCLRRHGISRLPEVEGEASPKRKFKAYPIGYFHIDIAEVRTAEGKLYLLVAIDRTSKFAFVELRETVSRRDAADFLRRLIEAVPYKVHTVLTDNGTHFTDPAGDSWSPVEIREMIAEQKPFRAHAFEYACALNDIDHRLTKPKHPWTNGQVERMNRTIKDATVKRYFYESHDQLRTHLRDFVNGYNFARRLKTLKGLTPYEFVCKAWTSQPQRFKLNPLQQMPGLNTYTGHLHLDDDFAWLGSPSALIMLSVAALVEVLAYYIPVVDNLLDVVAAPAAFIAGTILSAAVMTDMPPMVKWTAAVIAGGGVAGLTRGLTGVLRAHSTVLTGGLGNFVISTAELGGAALISFLALAAPVAAIALVALFLYVAMRLLRRLLRGAKPSNGRT